ncbi:hypothetical protein ACFW1P_28375 [Paenibacillus sp. NPDC058910]|uniref:hypothetical protein n=1 Tax=unclassified Paenibacillus TaxID=185978 RepID=UPI003685AB09
MELAEILTSWVLKESNPCLCGGSQGSFFCFRRASWTQERGAVRLADMVVGALKALGHQPLSLFLR